MEDVGFSASGLQNHKFLTTTHYSPVILTANFNLAFTLGMTFYDQDSNRSIGGPGRAGWTEPPSH